MFGQVFRDAGEFFVSLKQDGQEIDVAGPFGEAAEAMDMARRWAADVSVDCSVMTHVHDPDAWERM